MEPKDWINLALQSVGIGVALYVATRIARKQNEKVLVQNLEIKTYEELWLAIQSLNNSLVELSATTNMNLSFLETQVQREPLIGENQVESDYKKRTKINEYLSTFDLKVSEIRTSWGRFHQLWEQKEPIVTGLSAAFAAYKTEFEKLSNRLMFPSVNPWSLDITNFASTKPQLDTQNKETVEISMDLLVYGIDMSRMIQKRLLSKYYGHRPEERGLLAQSGYQLTEAGLVPVRGRS